MGMKIRKVGGMNSPKPPSFFSEPASRMGRHHASSQVAPDPRYSHLPATATEGAAGVPRTEGGVRGGTAPPASSPFASRSEAEGHLAQPGMGAVALAEFGAVAQL